MRQDTIVFEIDSNDPTLAHFGIKGMKWGVRRKRAADGRVGGKKGITDSKVFKTFVYDKTKSPLTKQGRAYQKQRKEEEKAKRIAKLPTDAPKFAQNVVKARNWLTDNEEVVMGVATVASVVAAKKILKANGDSSVSKLLSRMNESSSDWIPPPGWLPPTEGLIPPEVADAFMRRQ